MRLAGAKVCRPFGPPRPSPGLYNNTTHKPTDQATNNQPRRQGQRRGPPVHLPPLTPSPQRPGPGAGHEPAAARTCVVRMRERLPYSR
jgi:hypothetical protein